MEKTVILIGSLNKNSTPDRINKRQMAYLFKFKKNSSSIILLPGYHNFTIQLPVWIKLRKIYFWENIKNLGSLLINVFLKNHRNQIT